MKSFSLFFLILSVASGRLFSNVGKVSLEAEPFAPASVSGTTTSPSVVTPSSSSPLLTPEDIAKQSIIDSLLKAIDIGVKIESDARNKTPDDLGAFINTWQQVQDLHVEAEDGNTMLAVASEGFLGGHRPPPLGDDITSRIEVSITSDDGKGSHPRAADPCCIDDPCHRLGGRACKCGKCEPKIINCDEINDHCYDGIMNCNETAIDCGGGCLFSVGKCSMPTCPSCNDGILNCGEVETDCGGLCGACPIAAKEVEGSCPSCNDGIMNCDETGIDCGGSCISCDAYTCPCSLTAMLPCDCQKSLQPVTNLDHYMKNQIESNEPGVFSEAKNVEGKIINTHTEDLESLLDEYNTTEPPTTTLPPTTAEVSSPPTTDAAVTEPPLSSIVTETPNLPSSAPAALLQTVLPSLVAVTEAPAIVTSAIPSVLPETIASAPLDTSTSSSSISIESSQLTSANPMNDTTQAPLIGNEKSVTGEHQQFELSFAMMCGINISAGRSKTHSENLHMNEFMRIEHINFPPMGSSGEHPTPPTGLKEPFVFKDYAPLIFSKIRDRFEVDTGDYLVSLCGVSTYTEFLSNSKSGQFFFFSNDNKYMIKSQSKVESKFLRRIMPHYFQHVMNNPETYMTRFYGMHRVNMKPHKGTHFVIMANVFYTSNEIHIMYDLKGSTVGREATEKELKKFEAGLKVVMKDNDLQHPTRGNKICVGKDYKIKMLQQLKRDVSFLAKLQIMDYSLLLGIHQKKRKGVSTLTPTVGPVRIDDGKERSIISPLMNYVVPASPRSLKKGLEEGKGISSSKEIKKALIGGDETVDDVPILSLPNRKKTESVSKNEEGGSKKTSILTTEIKDIEIKMSEAPIIERDGGIHSVGLKDEEIYYIGVIDILQLYNSRKVAENFFKSFKYDAHEISSVNPVEYATRFLAFINKNSE